MGHHPTKHRPPRELRPRAEAAWGDLRRYFLRRGWPHAMPDMHPLAGISADIGEKAADTIASGTDLTVLAIEEKHGVRLWVDLGPIPRLHIVSESVWWARMRGPTTSRKGET